MVAQTDPISALQAQYTGVNNPSDADRTDQLVSVLAGISQAFSKAGAPRTLAQGGPGALDLGSVAAGLQALQGKQKQSRLADLEAGLVAIPALQKLRREKNFEVAKPKIMKELEGNITPLQKLALDSAKTSEGFNAAIREIADSDATGALKLKIAEINSNLNKKVAKSFRLKEDFGGLKAGELITGRQSVEGNAIETGLKDGNILNIPTSLVESVSIQGSRSDVGATQTKGQKGKALAASLSSAALIGRTTALMKQLDKAGPGAVGIRAKVAEQLGGLAGQFNASLGEEVSKGIAGVGVEELQAIRTNSRALVQASIRPIINEEGKITDFERQVANEVQRVDMATASLKQVQSSLRSSVVLQMISRDKATLQARGKLANPMIDSAGKPNKAEIAKVEKKLKRQGFTEEQAENAIIEIIGVQKELLQPGFFQ